MKGQLKRLIYRFFDLFGFEIYRTRAYEFTFSGICYQAVTCSVGRLPESELVAEGAVRMITERKSDNMHILDLACGIGVIGLTIFSKLGHDSTIQKVVFSDINIFNLNSLKQTLIINNLDHLVGQRLDFYLSDGLDHIPETERFDLIVANPPHFCRKDISAEMLSPARLGTFDPDWRFHRKVYAKCHNYLTERGEVWFLENSNSTKLKGFLPFIAANPDLKFLREVEETKNPNFYWMISARR